MRTSRSFLTTALAGTAALALFGGAVMAQEGSESDQPAEAGEPTDTSIEGLVDRLVDVTLDLDDALTLDITLDPVTGDAVLDAVGASVALEGESDRIRQLFIDADMVDGTTSGAIADVARGYLNIESSLTYLAEAEDYDLERSLATVDEDGVATGADPAIGLVEVSYSLIEDAARRIHPAFEMLAVATDGVDDAERSFFETRADDYQNVLDVTLAELRAAVSGRTTGVLVPVDRFDAGPGEARAREVEYTCIDRPVYPLAPAVEGQEPVVGEPIGDPNEAGDCPALPRAGDQPGDENVVTLAP